MRLRSAWLIGVAVFAAACSAAESAAPSTTTSPVVADLQPGGSASDGSALEGRTVVTLEIDGEPRSANVVVPDIDGPVPLVLVFHGFTSSSEKVEALTGFSDLGSTAGFAVAYPQGVGLVPRWRTSDAEGESDVLFVRRLVEHISDEVDIDGRRIYAIGMSNGGGMAARLGCDASDLFAAVGSVAGAYPELECDPDRAVPLVAFHGTADLVVRYEGFRPLLPPIDDWAATRAELNGCGGRSVEKTGVDVDRLAWSECDAAPVVLYRVEGGGHGWPGSDRAAAEGRSTTTIDATGIAWEFFAQHSLS